MKAEQKLMVETSLKTFGEAQVKVGGYSMWPFIRNGDVISITSGTDSAGFGKVAVFWAENQLIAHRIIGRKNRKSAKTVYKISGDFMRKSTSFLFEDEIMGTVSHIKRGGKTSKMWVNSPWVYLAVFLSFFFKFLNFHK